MNNFESFSQGEVIVIQSFLLVAAGGALGSMLRFAMGNLVSFPFGTMAVNILGAFFAGGFYNLLSLFRRCSKTMEPTKFECFIVLFNWNINFFTFMRLVKL